MQILSWHPRIVVFPNFIDKARAQHIIKLASNRMQPSDLSYRPNEKRDPKQQIRTSSGVFLNRYEVWTSKRC
jgi:prolyl 4-hydroxylase